MKKQIGVLLLFALITASVVGYVILKPKPIHMTFHGIKYRLGAEQVELADPVAIRVDGRLKTSLLGQKQFAGTIRIDGVQLPVPEDQQMLDIQFKENGVGIMKYEYLENKGERNERQHSFAFGSIDMNEDFSAFSIAVAEQKGSTASWNYEDGIMISAPASSRSEASQLTERLRGTED
ncbi:hypothetical protein [Paenibacillus methanolicus]|uniref:Uncharacterized protein n=1 Tax=Paenibacillus methanolicus TaxID=582686 RepID=A0A5S5C883_9BACL|nr:hypothetical protein [Paenibacillus methanolicus]TYP74540.1 hypothetical protein BCM02_10584 [Paenibacillus methanolicus]